MTEHATRDLLRLATAGSVDDGKSTLIGRLLYDTKSVLADQLSAVEAATLARGGGEVDLALLTDGLRAEREQGITIDVAYRYFSTATPRVRARRHPGARAVHAQHGDRRVHRRAGDRARRRPQGCARADPSARHDHRAAARPARGARREQDGPGRLRRGHVPRDRRRVHRLRAQPRHPRRHRGPALGARRRQRGGPLHADALVRRPDAAGAPRVGAGGPRRPVRAASGSPCRWSSARAPPSTPTTAATPAGSRPAWCRSATRSPCCRRASAARSSASTRSTGR